MQTEIVKCQGCGVELTGQPDRCPTCGQGQEYSRKVHASKAEEKVPERKERAKPGPKPKAKAKK